jgi:hypothetical protein
MLGGTGGYFLGLDAGVAQSSPGEPKAAFAGKWYDNDGTGSLYLHSSGDMKGWDQPRFDCGDGQYVDGDYVQDGDSDCRNSADENDSLTSGFSNDYQWVGSREYYGGLELNSGWYVSDSGLLCISYEGSEENQSISVVVCTRFKVTGKVLWILDEIDDGECEAYVDLKRENGPSQYPVSDTWQDNWEYIYSDYTHQKPKWCTEMKHSSGETNQVSNSDPGSLHNF